MFNIIHFYFIASVYMYVCVCVCRAVRYDDIYRMDEIKSHISYFALSFILWCR